MNLTLRIIRLSGALGRDKPSEVLQAEPRQVGKGRKGQAWRGGGRLQEGAGEGGAGGLLNQCKCFPGLSLGQREEMANPRKGIRRGWPGWAGEQGL